MNRRGFLIRMIGAGAAAVAVPETLLEAQRGTPKQCTIRFPDKPAPWICSGWVHSSGEGIPISNELGEMIEKLQQDKIAHPWEIKLF